MDALDCLCQPDETAEQAVQRLFELSRHGEHDCEEFAQLDARIMQGLADTYGPFEEADSD